MMTSSRSNDALGTANRGNPTEAGICTLCRADCQGKCETWLSSMMGRKMLYPRDFGDITTGSANTTHVGVSYNSLRIQGYNYGSRGLAQGLSNNPDDCVFPNVSLETSFGARRKTKARIPIMTGALGSTFIAGKYWDAFAVGAALVGYPIVVGENVVGIDKEAQLTGGRIIKALALGAPYAKLVCMGRALMIPGFLGTNIEGVFKPGKRLAINGHWEKLPNSVTQVGTYPDEIFSGYYEVQNKVGQKEMENIPFGAIAVWTLADKLAAGLQQFMAGARKFCLPEVSRDDIVSGNRETERETHIPFITDVQDDSARRILAS